MTGEQSVLPSISTRRTPGGIQIGTLTAEELFISGKRAVRLIYELSKYDRYPKNILITVNQDLDELGGSTRYPFSYQYQSETDERPYAIIKVIAGPGVSIKTQNFTDAYIAGPGYPLLEIIRVQDPQAVPPMAGDITTYDYCTPVEVNRLIERPGYLEYAQPPAENYIRIERFPNQVIFHHPYTEQALTLTVPEFDNTGGARDALARFAYEADPEGKISSNDKPLLKVVKTQNVKASVADERSSQWIGPGRPAKAAMGVFFFMLYDVGSNINDVPPQGYVIEPQRFWQQVTSFERDPSLQEELERLGVDIAISTIPVVGDIADIGEFAYGLVTGKDKWGRKLGTVDLVLMGVGALIPFVGGAALRAGRKFTRTFFRRAAAAETIARNLRRQG